MLKIILVTGIAVNLAACTNIGLLEQLETPGGEAGKTCGTNCRFFVTQNQHSGALGGAAGADQLCVSDPANPRGSGQGSWKAMLHAGAERQACSTLSCQSGGIGENINWVLRPLTNYRRPDGTYIATTSERAIFQTMLSATVSTVAADVWTGFSQDWIFQGNNCDGWKSSSGGFSGARGQANSMPPATIDTGAVLTCNSPASLYCIEQ